MRKWISLLGLAVLAVGCRQTSSLTEVKPDGSFQRTVKFSAMAPMMEEATPEQAINQAFDLPTGGDWKISKDAGSDPSGEMSISASRLFKAGEIAKDIRLKVKGKVVLANELAVKEIEPGVFEYRETFTWTGDKPTESPEERMDEALKALLKGKDKVTPAMITAMTTEMEKILSQLLFGPPEPLLPLALSSPEFFARKARAMAGARMLKAAESSFGDALSEPERRDLVMKILDPSLGAKTARQSAPTPPGSDDEESSDDSPTTLTMVVTMPGTVFETNGLTDPITGEVYWTMFADAAESGPVSIYAKSRR